MKHNTQYRRQDYVVEVDTDNVVEDSTENAEVGNEVQGGGDFINGKIKIYFDRKQAENFIQREKKAENFVIERVEIYIYKEAVSQPTTKKSMVVNSRKAQYYEAVLSAREEDMLNTPLSLSMVSVTEDSSEYGGREGVLAELGEQLKVFPPAQREKKYEVAEQRGVEKYNVMTGMRDKKNKLSEESCKIQRNRILQLLSWGCIGMATSATQSSL